MSDSIINISFLDVSDRDSSSAEPLSDQERKEITGRMQDESLTK